MRGKISAVVGTICAALSSAAHADVTISSATTQNMSCGGGICAPTASSAVLNVTDLENLLASGNVKVTTTGAGVQANNIDVDAALAWSSTGTLALDANQSITIDSAVSITGLSGLSLTTNDGGAGGVFSIEPGGNVSFQNLASQLAINGASYTLVGDISTLAADIAANSSGNFALASNYDASKDGTYQGSPIPTWFAGSFDGLGNTIANLAIGSTQHVGREPTGLFSIVNGGTVSHLDLSDVNIDVRKIELQQGVGALAGDNGGLLFEVRISGAVITSTTWAGGVAGYNVGTIVSSISTADVTDGAEYGAAGGVAGLNAGSISNSYGAGNATANKRSASAGGLVGINTEGANGPGEISNSQATGHVRANASFSGSAGGLVGANVGATINQSFSTGSVKGGTAGGFAGFSTNSDGAAVITESYSTGAVDGVSSDGVGGFIGYGGGASACYWDITTSGISGGDTSGITGLTSKQLRSGLPAGFDPAVWAEKRKINNGFPYLIADPPLK